MQTNTTQQPAGTSFVAVEGGGETRDGEKLLVTAYAVIWVILMVWIASLWRKQARLHERIDGLETAIDRASQKGADASAKG